jgi:iron(III) transport system substrate-binding protein
MMASSVRRSKRSRQAVVPRLCHVAGWLLVVLLTACGPALLAPPTPTSAPQDLSGQTLVVYAGRSEAAITPMIAAFQAATGVRVDLRSGHATDLGAQLLHERQHPVADIFIAGSGAEAERLAREGLFRAYRSVAAVMPAAYQDPDGLWTGLCGQARVILYNTQLVAAADIPTSVFELTDPRWHGKVAISGFHDASTVNWLAALIAVRGEAFTRKLLDDLIANGLVVLPTGGEVREKLAAGEYAIGLTNSPAYWMQQDDDAPVAFLYPDQHDDGLGTPVMISTVSIVTGTARLEVAQAFVDYALGVEATRLLVAPPSYELALFALDSSPGGSILDFRATEVSVRQLADIEEQVRQRFSPPF